MFISKDLQDWFDVIHSRDLKNAQPHILNVWKMSGTPSLMNTGINSLFLHREQSCSKDINPSFLSCLLRNGRGRGKLREEPLKLSFSAHTPMAGRVFNSPSVKMDQHKFSIFPCNPFMSTQANQSISQHSFPTNFCPLIE